MKQENTTECLSSRWVSNVRLFNCFSFHLVLSLSIQVYYNSIHISSLITQFHIKWYPNRQYIVYTRMSLHFGFFCFNIHIRLTYANLHIVLIIPCECARVRVWIKVFSMCSIACLSSSVYNDEEHSSRRFFRFFRCWKTCRNCLTKRGE